MALIDFSLSDIGSLFTDIRAAITGKTVLDPQKALELELKVKELEQSLLTGQIEVNKIEAQHASIFVAGWRPAIGWIAAASLALMYIPKAIVMTVIWTWQCIKVIQSSADIAIVNLPHFPDLGAMDIIGLVSSMLGVAWMRTIDKKNNTDTKVVK